MPSSDVRRSRRSDRRFPVTRSRRPVRPSGARLPAFPAAPRPFRAVVPADGGRAVRIAYARLLRHLGEPGPGATGEFGPVERLLCAVFGDPHRYGAVDVAP